MHTHVFNIHTPMHACTYAQPMQTYILHPNMKIIKIKASDLYEKQQKNIHMNEESLCYLYCLKAI